ncbi:uncharacterized protein BO66DRAFT_395578 [Aspergillus aculeatinus CBS 121060]|uniref:Uncharacterized protein n=1 Tax=Aspergillus aculeatinus CBS 121060 TaxID=1448322 RepID=A0ACD1GVA5_9EURO|nr:hypothetical protein BO66DRAFT_395578 [Aspergillus aculeatinus CBS 121060]RAH65206.1 hypothetical protein BO66DRAFT_395578 [Aspergillus aculeatinus CBS 121060]
MTLCHDRPLRYSTSGTYKRGTYLAWLLSCCILSGSVLDRLYGSECSILCTA